MSRVALFPGTYDPFTLGHYDLVIRALRMFDKVVIAVGDNMQKRTMFTLEERIQMIQGCFEQDSRVEVLSYPGLTADFCKEREIKFIVRGVRNAIDFGYEGTIAQANTKLWDELESVFMMTKPELAYISSSLVRELLYHNGEVKSFLPEGMQLPARKSQD